MPKNRKSTSEVSKRQTDQGRESFLVNLAYNIAEKQLLEGTASSQIIAHFLKLGTQKYKLENEKLKSDLDVAKAKIRDFENREDTKVLYQEAINAFRSYMGNSNTESGDDQDVY